MPVTTISLRGRLFLAFLAVALILAVLSVLAVHNSWRIRRQVMGLTSISIARFESSRSVGQALEIEGDWQPAADGLGGALAASEFQVLTEPRRPKLRGAVLRNDAEGRRLWMYGVPIAVDASTEFLDQAQGNLAAVKAGDRLEISCSLDDEGHWSARKIRSVGLKASDKIKGVVTSVSMDGISPDTLVISGITVLLQVDDRAPNPRVELKRITLATRMSLALQDCDLAVRGILERPEVPITGSDGETVGAPILLAESIDLLTEAVARARVSPTAVGAGPAGEDLRVDSAFWLQPLAGAVVELDSLTSALAALAPTDREGARALYRTRIEPLLLDHLRPLARSYLLDAEERLALEVEEVSAQAQATSRALLGAAALSLVVSMSLGYGIWRSIARPIMSLQRAAERIGQGHLDARAEVTSRDELGLLASTINRMADDLALTTVSIAKLDDILESMAGALFVLGDDGRVVSANRAAGALLGGPAESIVGLEFHRICEGFEPQPAGTGPLSGERTLRRLDGTRVAVSFSGAPLGRGDGAGHGLVCVAQDLSERKRLEDRLLRSISEKELLLREIHHRVKNNLQIISSLLDLQSDRIEDPLARTIYADSQARIRSMALIHQQLYGADALDRIDFGAYLEQLAASLFHFGGSGPVAVSIRVEADSARLDIDQALTCGLIVNELVINALKHAFPEGNGGTITLGFHRDGDRYRLSVADDGVGLPTGAWNVERGSLGTGLVTALVEQLDGTLEISATGGTAFTILFAGGEVAA